MDIRVIAATNQDPYQAVRRGSLREDLFYRLNVVQLEMPPLRQHPEDIPLLVEHFLEKQRSRRGGERKVGITEAALAKLQSYPWPGNVRELHNVLERAVVLSRGGPIDVEHLPREMQVPATEDPSFSPLPLVQGLALGPAVENVEKVLISRALAQAKGNKAKAARLLEISERSLWYKLKNYGLS